jgi:hypothetical protein
VERLEVCPRVLVASLASRTSRHRRLASRAGAGVLLDNMGKRSPETRGRGGIERASDSEMGQPSCLLAPAPMVLRDALRSGLRFHAAVVVACPSAVPWAWPVSVGSGAIREREGLRCCAGRPAAVGSIRLAQG